MINLMKNNNNHNKPKINLRKKELIKNKKIKLNN